jgi:hypothetical protein
LCSGSHGIKKNKKHGSQCGKIENKKPHNLRGGVDAAEK